MERLTIKYIGDLGGKLGIATKKLESHRYNINSLGFE
jgi:hypothetical protein